MRAGKTDTQWEKFILLKLTKCYIRFIKHHELIEPSVYHNRFLKDRFNEYSWLFTENRKKFVEIFDNENSNRNAEEEALETRSMWIDL